MPVKNYVYRCYPPSVRAKEVSDQMWHAHRYRNKLVEIELAKRAAANATIRRISPEYDWLAGAADAADQVVEAIYTELKAARAKARKRIELTPEQKTLLSAAKTARAKAWSDAKPARDAAYKQLAELQEPIWREAEHAALKDADLSVKNRTKLESARKTILANPGDKSAQAAIRSVVRYKFRELAELAGMDAGEAAQHRAVIEARATCGLYWATYLTIEAAMEKANQGGPPRYKSWTGDGTIAVQLQGGLSVADVTACGDRRLQIAVSHEDELADLGQQRHCYASAKNITQHKGISTVRLRIGSEGQEPIWSEFPVFIHRPLPSNGTIKWAYIDRRRMELGESWQLRITVETPAQGDGDCDSTPAIASVHLGWRLMPDRSLRVATVFTTEGQTKELRLPASFLDGLDRASAIQEERDHSRNEFVPKLKDWLIENADILPDWLAPKAAQICRWVAAGQFAALCSQWWSNRFGGDSAGFELFDYWRKRDKILYQQKENLIKKTLATRKQIYCSFATELRDNYAALVMIKVDWKELRERPAPEDGDDQSDRLRQIAGLASPGILGQMIRERCAAKLTELKPHDVTSQCHLCGQVDEFDHQILNHTCSACGESWDQDHNAARVTLARGLMLDKVRSALGDQAAKGVMTVYDLPERYGAIEEKTTARKVRRNRRQNQHVGSER